MKITFVMPHAGLAGGTRVIATYAKILKTRGHNITVISLPERTPSLKQQLKYFLKNKKLFHKIRTPSHFDTIDVDHHVLGEIRPITNDDVPDSDAVIATWWETAEWVHRLDRSKGKQFYFIQHHEIHKGLPVQRVKATYLLPLHKIAISRWLFDIMTNEYGDDNVSLVPNSVDSSLFSCPTKNRNIAPVIGFMYSTHYTKGVCNVIKALNNLKKVIPHLRIISFGAIHIDNQLPIPFSTEFYYRPTQKKICEIYSSCDYWVAGSLTEGFGLPILEAMACRTPVISTPAGAAPEILEKGGGLLVNGYSEEELTKKLIEAINLPDSEWQSISENARKTATEYTWDDAAKLFEQALLRQIG